MTSLPRTSDFNRRTATRARSLLGGQILLDNRLSSVDCVVRNVSPTGARIQMSNAHVAPLEFDIFVPKRNHTYRARTVWRDGDLMGVQFQNLESRNAAQLSPEQTRTLAVKNAKLRDAIRNLRRRLQAGTDGEG